MSICCLVILDVEGRFVDIVALLRELRFPLPVASLTVLPIFQCWDLQQAHMSPLYQTLCITDLPIGFSGGGYSKLRKATNIFFTSVRLCARNNSAPTWRIFTEILYFCIFQKKIFRKTQFSFKPDPKITLPLQEDVCTFVIILRWILLRMKYVSEKFCRQDQNTHFTFSNFSPPPKIAPFMR